MLHRLSRLAKPPLPSERDIIYGRPQMMSAKLDQFGLN